jgi:hypothetical protein
MVIRRHAAVDGPPHALHDRSSEGLGDLRQERLVVARPRRTLE